jgi:hypothetical protein
VPVYFPSWGQGSELCDKVIYKSLRIVDQVYP